MFLVSYIYELYLNCMWPKGEHLDKPLQCKWYQQYDWHISTVDSISCRLKGSNGHFTKGCVITGGVSGKSDLCVSALSINNIIIVYIVTYLKIY